MDKFKFEPVWIGKKDSIVAQAILRIIGWGVEHRSADLVQQIEQAIHISARGRVPGNVVKSGRIRIVAMREAIAHGPRNPD